MDVETIEKHHWDFDCWPPNGGGRVTGVRLYYYLFCTLFPGSRVAALDDEYWIPHIVLAHMQWEKTVARRLLGLVSKTWPDCLAGDSNM